MTVDAKIVDKALRTDVFGLLKEMGFARRKGLKLWRDHEFFVDIAQFHHLNSNSASVIGTETFSVSIELGVFLKNTFREVPMEGNNPLPDASDGHFRGVMRKNLQQPKLERRDVWHINPDGANLEEVIMDIRGIVKADMPAWFGRVHDLDAMREMLESESPEVADQHIPLLFGFGNPGSPMRQKVTAAVNDVLAKMRGSAHI